MHNIRGHKYNYQKTLRVKLLTERQKKKEEKIEKEKEKSNKYIKNKLSLQHVFISCLLWQIIHPNIMLCIDFHQNIAIKTIHNHYNNNTYSSPLAFICYTHYLNAVRQDTV